MKGAKKMKLTHSIIVLFVLTSLMACKKELSEKEKNLAKAEAAVKMREAALQSAVNACFDHVKKQLKDPFSAVIAESSWEKIPPQPPTIVDGMKIDTWKDAEELLLKYRAKNSYGAYELSEYSCIFRQQDNTYFLEEGLMKLRKIEKEIQILRQKNEELRNNNQ
jgi:hypothetical protein